MAARGLTIEDPLAAGAVLALQAERSQFVEGEKQQRCEQYLQSLKAAAAVQRSSGDVPPQQQQRPAAASSSGVAKDAGSSGNSSAPPQLRAARELAKRQAWMEGWLKIAHNWLAHIVVVRVVCNEIDFERGWASHLLMIPESPLIITPQGPQIF